MFELICVTRENMELHDLLPKWLADRIATMTGTTEALDALERLCDMGCVEMALLLTQAMLNISREGMDAVPINAKVTGCKVIREDRTNYLIFELENDLVCVAQQVFEQERQEGETTYVRKWSVARPCTRNEYEYVVSLLGLGEKSMEVRVALP